MEEKNSAEPISLAQFVKTLHDSGILTVEEIEAIQTTWPPDSLGAEPAVNLAMELIRHRRLTPYQAKVVYNGLPHRLVFDNYVVTDKIGQGGMGLVFKVRHRLLQQEGALKIVSAHGMTKSKTAVERFRREMEYVGRLSHPNVVRAIHAGQIDGAYFLVTEFVNGEDLKKRVKDHGPLSVPDAVNFTIQAARGLQHAHEQGIIHRDIKPGNLLIDQQGIVKLLDFGLARLDDPEQESNLTQTLTVLGTAEYISPEQSLDTRQADQRSDVYSLGCTFFFLLTGRPMYTGSSPVGKMLAHRQQPIPSLIAERPDVSPAIEAVHKKMVAKSPDDRLPSMNAVAEALEAAMHVSPEPKSVVVQPSVQFTTNPIHHGWRSVWIRLRKTMRHWASFLRHR